MFEKSAEQGHAKAQFKLGIFFLYVMISCLVALIFIEGMMCKRGDAHAMDKTKAFEMMEKSAALGNADAQNMLGIFFIYTKFKNEILIKI